MKMSRNVGMIETYHWSYVQFFRVVQYSCLLSRMTIQQSTASAPQSIGRVATSVWVERRGIPMSQGGIKINRGRPFSPLVCARGTSRWPPAEQTENDNQVASIRTACVQAVWNNVAARSIHNERGDTTRWRQQLLSMLCGAEDSGTAGTAALPRRGHGNTAAAGGGGGRHRTLGDGGRLAGVSAAAAGAAALVVVATSPLLPHQWKRPRRRRLCFGHEPAAWPCGETDTLAKSIHSTTANCFSSWKGGFDAFPSVGSDNGNRSLAVSMCFTDRSSFRSSPDRLRPIFCEPERSEPRDCSERATDERKARDVMFWQFGHAWSSTWPTPVPVLLHRGHDLPPRHPVHPSTRPLNASIADWRCRTVVRMPHCTSSSILLWYVGGSRPFFEGF